MLKQQDTLAVDLVSTDIDDQSLMLDGWQQCYTQLEAGPFEARAFSLAVSDGINLFRKSTNRRMHKSFVCPGEETLLAVVLPGSDVALFQGRELISGDVFVISPGIELELVCHGHFDVAVVPVDPDLSIDTSREDNDYNHIDVGEILPGQVTEGFASQLYAAFLSNNLNAGALHSMCAPSVKAIYQRAGTQGEDDSVDDVIFRATRLVEQRLEEMDDLPTIPEIAAYAGGSERALEYAFARRYGVSPTRYFMFKRLHGARRDIRDHQLNVTDAAIKWGFSHLGRFSGVYRDTFGELPSHTK